MAQTRARFRRRPDCLENIERQQSLPKVSSARTGSLPPSWSIGTRPRLLRLRCDNLWRKGLARIGPTFGQETGRNCDTGGQLAGWACSSMSPEHGIRCVRDSFKGPGGWGTAGPSIRARA